MLRSIRQGGASCLFPVGSLPQSRSLTTTMAKVDVGD